MYLVIGNAFKRGPNKSTKNIERNLAFFSSKTYQQDFDHVKETWQATHNQAHVGLQLFPQNPYFSKFNNSSQKIGF
jgi:hypothetical protein